MTPPKKPTKQIYFCPICGTEYESEDDVDECMDDHELEVEGEDDTEIVN
jgi:hypothetical protein